MRQTLICVLGVLISVAMFITQSAMMSGFQDKFIVETVESGGHVIIADEPRQVVTPILQRMVNTPDAVLAMEGVKPREQIKQIKNPTGLIRQLERMPQVIAAAPSVTGNVVASFGTKTFSLVILGVEPEQQLRVTTIGDKIIAGSFDRLKKAANGVVLGRGIALTLGVRVDDSITLASPSGAVIYAKVVGIFETGIVPVDYSRAYMLLSPAQTLLDKRNVVNEIVLRLDDYNTAPEVAAQIEQVIGYKTQAWQETNENFMKIFAIQKIITLFINGALMVVAGFGVLNIMVMAVMERVNDIAILKSFGLSRGDITRVYLVQGAIIAVIGASIGIGIGKVAIEILRVLPIELEGLVRSEGLLMSESAGQYLSAFFGALIVVLLAAVYPARRAARFDPVDVIRGAH